MSTLGEEILKQFPDAEIISCKMLYEEEINKYIQQIEEAHKQAGNSKLVFKNETTIRSIITGKN